MRNLKNQRGAALLETAVTLPLILLVSVAIFEFGRAYQTWQVLTNAAREGARVAVLFDKTDTDVSDTVQAYMTSGKLIETPSISVNRNMTLGANSVSEVTVNYPFKFIVLNPVIQLVTKGSTTGKAPLTMQAIAVMRNES